MWKIQTVPLGMLNTRRVLRYASFVIYLTVAAVATFWFTESISSFFESWKEYGYLGVIALAFVVNASFIFPTPLIAVSLSFAISFASQTDPFSVAVVYAFGATLGEGVGYPLGLVEKKIIGLEKTSFYQRFSGWLNRYGGRAIFIATILPFPPFDIMGFVAGSLRYPWWKFLIFCFMGRTIKYLILIGTGFEIWKVLFG